jgi:hypothetical protein
MEECTICFSSKKAFELNDEAVSTAYSCERCWIYIALFAILKTSLGTRVFFLIEMPIILLVEKTKRDISGMVTV